MLQPNTIQNLLLYSDHMPVAIRILKAIWTFLLIQKKISLLDIIGIEQELSEQLGVKVDLVTARSIHLALQKHIDQDLVTIT